MENNNLSEAAVAARRAYQKAWRANNREKVRAHEARYWERKAAQIQSEIEVDNADEQ